jgi:hypothetical protein
MFFDPPAIFLLIVLVGVTGWVTRGLMVTWYNLRGGRKASHEGARDVEERLRKLEAATSSLITDVTGMREKERFMARLQASAASHEVQTKSEVTRTGELSPMVTQSIPVMPRAGRQR